MGRLAKFTWFPRASEIAPGQELPQNGSSIFVLAAGFAVLGAALFLSSEPEALRTWPGALILAGVVGAFFGPADMLSWQRIIRALEDGHVGVQ